MTRLPNAPTAAVPRRVLYAALAAFLAGHGALGADAPAAKLPKGVQGAQCRSSAPEDPRLAELRAADPDDPHVDITSDTGEMGRDGDATLHGNVTVRTGQRLLLGEDAQIDANNRNVSIEGNVEYLDPQLHVRGTSGSFHGKAAGQVEGAEFELIEQSVRGAAADAAMHEDGTIDLKSVRYTACPPGNEDWRLKADSISIDQKNRVGTGRDVRLDFMGVPIFYTPWISFPVGEERKSGLLFPTVGSSSKTGTQVAIPWYWNIAPNMDATITGRWYSSRGARLDPQFRYLAGDSRGEFDAEYLFHDQTTGDARSFVDWRHVTRFGESTRLFIDAADVSDDRYFEDFGVGFDGTSLIFLSRLMELRNDSEHWMLRARAQNYQVLDEALADPDRPYTILPQLSAVGRWRDLPGGLSASLLAEAVNFQRDLGPEGVRVDAEPGLAWRLDSHGAYLSAAASWRYTQYSLDGMASGSDSPSLSAPITSIDTGLVLERAAGSQGHKVQTLEPRLMYLYVPYRNQDDMPVFDTGLPDLNLVQLFRTNRYVGADRLGDANQVNVGITTRLLDADRGRQFLSATLGQAFYIEQPRVRLPDEPARDRSTSDMIAEVELSAFKDWNARFGYQWNPDQTLTERSEVFLQYRPAGDKVVNLGYRFRRDLLEQFDVSTAWPIKDRWHAYARWVYSLDENKTLDQFVGVEYSSCCWALRLVTRHFVSSRTGSSDTSVSIQLELKGLSNVGTDTETFLRDAIRGYSPVPPAPRS
jgi:LPS-assembly protein